ncbi:uncharacterized protein [Engystomops pustulosus]|uniref:uncharacterized protein n=1 Tax=Engystomops pustulosus TaxID=76066 RepID=UPI003AFA8FEE
MAGEDITTTQSTDSTTEDITTTQSTDSTTEDITTRQSTDSTTEDITTTQSTDSTTKDITTRQLTDSTTEDITTRQSTDSTTKSITTRQSTDSTTEEVTTTQSTDSTTKDITTGQSTDSTTEDITTRQSTDSTTEDITTRQSTESTTEDITTTQSTDSTTEDITTTQSTDSTTEDITTGYSSESTKENLTTSYPTYSTTTTSAGSTTEDKTTYSTESTSSNMSTTYSTTLTTSIGTAGPTSNHITSLVTDANTTSNTTIISTPGPSTVSMASVTSTEYTPNSTSSIVTPGGTSPSLSKSTAGSSSSGSTELHTEPETSGATEQSTSSGHPQSTSTPLPTSTTSGACGVGGYYNDSLCVCKENFYGNDCNFISNEIRPAKVIIKVIVTVYIVNEVYTEDLNNKGSSVYKNFTARFIQQINIFYGLRVPHFIEVRISAISQGSIRVDHEVLLSVDSNNVQEQHAAAVRSINDAVKTENCTMNSTSEAGILCFNSSRSNVNEQFDVTGLCSGLDTIPVQFQQYFSGIMTSSNQFLCVSKCSGNSPNFMNCNHGQCLVSVNGPNCYCESSSQFWYSGAQCQVAVSKPGVIGGVVAGVAVLLIIILLLAVFLYRRKYTDSRRLIDPDRSSLNEEWGYTAKEPVFVNPSHVLETSSESDAASITIPSSGTPRGSSGRENFQVSLEKVNTQKMPIPRSNFANQP